MRLHVAIIYSMVILVEVHVCRHYYIYMEACGLKWYCFVKNFFHNGKTFKKKKHILIYFWDVIYGYISRPERVYIFKICGNLDLSPTVVISHFSPIHYKIKVHVFNNSLTNIFYL